MSDPACDTASVVEPSEVRRAAMNLLARREHSAGELRQKLGRRFADADLVEAQVERLAQEGLQSDRRFAESFVRQRVARGQGPLRIRGEMQQRQLDDALIAAALEASETDWQALAESTLLRRFGGGPAADQRERGRRARFLQYRGFAHEHYHRLLD